MIEIPSRVLKLSKLIQDNSPLILTSVGAVGVITTALLTAKATIKAVEVIHGEQERLDSFTQSHPLSAKEKMELTWKLYILPTATGFAAITAIITANRIGMRRAAAVAVAFKISEEAFAEYRERVVEKIGEKKEEEVRAQVAQDRVNRSSDAAGSIIISSGKVLCYDKYSDRYFESSVEEIKKAANDTYYQMNHEGYASLSDFYERVGLPHTGISDEVGWNIENRPLDVRFDTAITTDQRPCIVIEFHVEPIRSFYRCN